MLIYAAPIQSSRSSYERHSYLCLEAGVEGGEEGVAGGQREYSSLGHRALHVVVLNYHIFFEDFHCVHLVSAFLLGEHHLQPRSQH